MFRSTIVALFLLGSTCPALTGSTQSRRLRSLIPSPPHIGHGIVSKAKYKGCLGLSKEELEIGMKFEVGNLWKRDTQKQKDDMPQCEIVVDGTTIVANTVSSSVATESSSVVATNPTASTEATTVYQEVASGQSDTSGGSDDNIDDQEDEVNGDGDQSSSSGGEENNEDETADSIEDNSNTSEIDESGENEAALDETNIDNQASDSTTDDENSAKEDEPNPLHFFDMQDCGTFAALWMWDLALTCQNSTSLVNCSCTAAKIHITYGEIECMNDECPSNCPVCDMCMRLSECGPNKELQRGAAFETDTTEVVPIAFIGLTAALFGIQLVLFKVYWGRRTQPGGILGSQLMDQEVV